MQQRADPEITWDRFSSLLFMHVWHPFNLLFVELYSLLYIYLNICVRKYGVQKQNSMWFA